jgi:hypothetical protein
VREVQEVVRAHHDDEQARKGHSEVPEVQEHESYTSARRFHGADVQEELSVVRVDDGTSCPELEIDYKPSAICGIFICHLRCSAERFRICKVVRSATR